jgi:dipeptidase E
MGNHPEELVSLVELGRRAVVIANAMDDQPEEDREAGVRRELDALAGLGIEAEELDLRTYFGQSDRLHRDLQTCGLVWLRGGNVFMLRSAWPRVARTA